MKRSWRNIAVAGSCFVAVAGMVGLCYAAVPFYYAFCRATGYGGTPNRATAAPGIIENRVMTVRFDTNVDPALPWSFQPEQRSVRVKIGEDKLVYFRAVNHSGMTIVGRASFNVQPDSAAHYFNKIQCFCFTEQTLAPGQSVEMPVSFFISPTIMKNQDDDDVTEMTLSYTFYPSANPKAAVTAAAGTKAAGG